jgi:oligopeptide transport system substrate-binding protein
VTAADYVYGWQRAADPKNASNYAWFIELTGVTNASEVVPQQSPDALGSRRSMIHPAGNPQKPGPLLPQDPLPLHHLPGPKATMKVRS